MNEVDSTIQEITGQMPEPQEHAIQAETDREKRTQETTSANRQYRDRDGNVYDPDLHEIGADGQPVFNKDGSLKKKRGRGAAKAKANAGQSQLNRPGAALGGAGSDDPRKAGAAIAESIFQVGLLLGGEEWQPIVNKEYGMDERANMYDVWGRYCEAKGVNDFPPGVAVTMAMVAYAVPRLTTGPVTKTRLQKAKEWVYSKIGAWRGRKAAAPKEADKKVAAK